MFFGFLLVIIGTMLSDRIEGMIAFGLGMIIIMSSMAKAMQELEKQSTQPKEKKCPPHSWSYDIQGLLYCSECKKYPGEIQSDYDKPY